MSGEEVFAGMMDTMADRLAERLCPAITERLAETTAKTPWLDYQGASDYLHVPVDTLKKMVRTMPHRKVGRRVLFNKAELDAWLDGRYEGPRRVRKDRLRAV